MYLKQPTSWIELDSTAFNHNIAGYRSILGPQTQLAVVVKSNAYGHGMHQVGSLCQQNADVNWLCTTSLSEALQLRAQGITKPLLVLALVDQNPLQAIEQQIDLPVFDLQTAQEFNAIAKQASQQLRIHIKIDTGMSRFGLTAAQSVQAIKEIAALQHLNITGIFTHCAESPNADAQFTLTQLQQFNQLCQQLETAGINIPFKHAANSAAVRFHNQFEQFNFVRVGAGAYGLQHFKDPATFAQLDIQPVMTWKTHISHIKEIPTHTPVGYDRTFVTKRPTSLAYLPIGYFEGYDRRLSNIGIVCINNYLARVAGRVCMNVLMVEIPENQTAHVGDQVILLGNIPGLTAYDIATTINSNNAREITSRINANINRIII